MSRWSSNLGFVTSDHPDIHQAKHTPTFTHHPIPDPSDGPSGTPLWWPEHTTIPISNQNSSKITNLGYIPGFQQKIRSHSRSGVHPCSPTIYPSNSPSTDPTEHLWGNPHLMPQVTFHSIYQQPARLDRRSGVRLEISNRKTHYISQLGSILEISQETYMARLEQSHTQLPPKHNSIMFTQPHSFFKLYPNTSPSIHPSCHSYQSPIITHSTWPTPNPSHTWAIPGRLERPHGSHCTCVQGWIPIPGPVPDLFVYPVVHRG